jgi:hypothetical protein
MTFLVHERYSTKKNIPQNDLALLPPKADVVPKSTLKMAVSASQELVYL